MKYCRARRAGHPASCSTASRWCTARPARSTLNEVLEGVGFGPQSTDAVLLFGVIFVVAGVAFKMGAVPFHMCGA